MAKPKKTDDAPAVPQPTPPRQLLAALIWRPEESDTDPFHGATVREVHFGGNLAPGVAVQESVFEALAMSDPVRRTAGDSAYWRTAIIFTGLASILPAAERFAAIGDLANVPGSTLYGLGESIAFEVRRRMLLHELETTEWNLSHVADRLRLRSASKVLEAIRAHGLEAEYEQAKAEGRAAGKTRKTRADEPNR